MEKRKRMRTKIRKLRRKKVLKGGGGSCRELTTGTSEGPQGVKRADGADSDESQMGSEQGGYRRNGNVARLSKAVRDKVNGWIEDGVTYGEIIERLGEDGKGLDASNLSRWKDGGYQDWLAAQAFVARTRARQETPVELVGEFDATQVNHAALQLGTLHIYEALKELGPGSLNKKLGGDCAAFARLLNALARASKETMQLQKYRKACARARAQLRELKDPKRKLDESETRAIVRKVDEILGFGSPEDEEAQPGQCGVPISEANGVVHAEATPAGSAQQVEEAPAFPPVS